MRAPTTFRRAATASSHARPVLARPARRLAAAGRAAVRPAVGSGAPGAPSRFVEPSTHALRMFSRSDRGAVSSLLRAGAPEHKPRLWAVRSLALPGHARALQEGRCDPEALITDMGGKLGAHAPPCTCCFRRAGASIAPNCAPGRCRRPPADTGGRRRARGSRLDWLRVPVDFDHNFWKLPALHRCQRRQGASFSTLRRAGLPITVTRRSTRVSLALL